MVDPQAMHQRRLNVVDVYRILHYVVAIIVRFPYYRTGFDASPGHPHGEATGMVIAAIIRGGELALAVDGAPEFPTPNHERLIEQPTLFQVAN